MVLALVLAWIPSLSRAGALPVFGELTGSEGEAVLERYFEVFGGHRLDFDQVQQETNLDTEFSDSHGVTFWTTSSSVGTPLATPHNLSGTHGVSDIAEGAIGGSPFPEEGFDSRPTYDIRFNEPQRWAGLDRMWSTWNTRCLTRFYARDGSLIAELNGFPEPFVGYSCENENPDTWIIRIECTGELLDGIPQVGPSDNLLFGTRLDTQSPDIFLRGDNPLYLTLGTLYVEPGFAAIDAYQGDMTASVQVSGTIDSAVPGPYILRYNVTDAWSNAAEEVLRTVQMIDDVPSEVEDQASPSGYIDATKRPIFSWERVSTAEKYCLTVWDASGKTYYTKWLPGTTCLPPSDFEEGEYTWAVQTWNSFGFGEISEPVAFEIALVIPPAATPLTPEGTVAGNQPTFSWTEEKYASASQVVVQRSGKTVLKRWVKGVNAYIPEHDDRLQYGQYTWWIRGWGLDGLGTWSDPMEFTYGLVTPLAPGGQNHLLDRRPTFEWSSLADAEWYHVHISRNGETFASEWIKSEHAWWPAEDLPPGDYSWWVRAWNERGTGPWSEEARFDVGAVIPLQPAGILDEMPSVLTWNNSEGAEATWFRVQIDQDGTAYDDFWVPVGDTMLDGVNRIIDWPEDLVLLPGGSYTWRIRTWQPSGLGPWSGPVTFSVP